MNVKKEIRDQKGVIQRLNVTLLKCNDYIEMAWEIKRLPTLYADVIQIDCEMHRGKDITHRNMKYKG